VLYLLHFSAICICRMYNSLFSLLLFNLFVKLSLPVFHLQCMIRLCSITFGEFFQQFPAKVSSHLHFRFKTEDPSNSGDRNAFVWADIDSNNHASKLPLFDGCLVAKVLNLDSVASSKRVNKLRLKLKSDLLAKPTGSNISAEASATQHINHSSTSNVKSYEPYSDNSSTSQGSNYTILYTII
jgi:hypothetical protein